MHVMDAEQALAWANSLSHALAAAMGCKTITITLDILSRFYLPANKDGSIDEARKTNILGGIIRAGGCENLAAGVAKRLRCQNKKNPDANYVKYAIKGVLRLTGKTIPENQYNPFRRCIELVNDKINSKLDEEPTYEGWTEAEEEKLLEIQSLLNGGCLVWILTSLAFEGKGFVAFD